MNIEPDFDALTRSFLEDLVVADEIEAMYGCATFDVAAALAEMRLEEMHETGPT